MKIHQPPLFGLVLIGGQSRRMGTDKSTLAYHGTPQWLHTTHLLRSHCEAVYLSERSDSARGVEAGISSLPDSFNVGGPINGILTALHERPEAAWLVLACDLPAIDEAEIAHLVRLRSPDHIATALADPDSGYPEPLAAIWEPTARPHIMKALASGHNPGPSAILLEAECKTIFPLRPEALHNINTPEECATMMKATKGAAPGSP
ncbi:MAG: NTP transferase domain-containing protein [Opitutales bacterium]